MCAAMSLADVTAARNATRGVKNVVHLNNAGSSLMPDCVVDATVDFLQREAEIGGYEAAAERVNSVQGVYRSLERLLGAREGEIAAVENATRGWDYAFYSLPLTKGDVILTTETEYGSNFLSFLQVCKKTGAVVEVVPSDSSSGSMSCRALSERLTHHGAAAKLVAVSHIPTSTAVIHSAEEIGRVCRSYQVPYILDACQSAGHIALDVASIGCDVLTGSARKYLRGPRGQGFMYVRHDSIFDRIEPCFLDVRAARTNPDDPRDYEIQPGAIRYENFERSYPNWVGLGAAVEYALQWGLDTIEERITTLARSLRSQLSGIPGVKVQDFGHRKSGIVTFTSADASASAIKAALGRERVHVSVSTTNSTPYDMHARGLCEVVRVSPHYYNTEDEITLFLHALRHVVRRESQ